MDDLPSEILQRILSRLDYRQLANAALVCKGWCSLSGQRHLWQRLYEQRWGKDLYVSYKFTSWKAAYEAQDRRERIGMEMNITREGLDYFLVHQGRLLRFLGSRQSHKQGSNELLCKRQPVLTFPPLSSHLEPSESREGLVNELLFFLGDLECAIRKPKRVKVS